MSSTRRPGAWYSDWISNMSPVYCPRLSDWVSLVQSQNSYVHSSGYQTQSSPKGPARTRGRNELADFVFVVACGAFWGGCCWAAICPSGSGSAITSVFVSKFASTCVASLILFHVAAEVPRRWPYLALVSLELVGWITTKPQSKDTLIETINRSYIHFS